MISLAIEALDDKELYGGVWLPPLNMPTPTKVQVPRQEHMYTDEYG